MINISNIEDTLYNWVSGVSGIETIFAHPNAPRPIVPYVLINLFSTTPIGIAEHIDTLLVNNSVDIDYSNVEELSVSINVYYDNAFQTATKLKDSLARITVSDQLFAGGLGYILAATVQEIPEKINKKWEQRAQFDCSFYTRSTDEENIESINKIEITNKIDDETTIIEEE